MNCKINICPLCKLNHDKEHKIINYDNKDNICITHFENYIKYCYKCKMNLCIKCEKNHIKHNCISFGEILPEDNINDELKEYIDKLKEEINKIIEKLNNVVYNIELYYNIINNINKNKYRNYHILKNINEFIKYNNLIINDIKEINNDDNINNKFNNLMKIYDKINKNYIIGEIEIKKEDINKDIRIITLIPYKYI